jgi:hypothetical protein
MTALCQFEIFFSFPSRKGTRAAQTAAIFFIGSAAYRFSALGASTFYLRSYAAGLNGIELIPPIIQLPHYSTASRTIILMPGINARGFARSHSLARSEGQGFNYLYDHRPSLFAVFRSWHRLHSACQFD